MILCVILLVIPGPGQALEEPRPGAKTLEKRRRPSSSPHKGWALVVTAPESDAVELSRWYTRRMCERRRASIVRAALQEKTPIPGTRCVARSWRTWIGSFLGGRDYVTLEEYLQDAVDLATQEDVAGEFQAHRRDWRSPTIQESTSGRTEWMYRFELPVGWGVKWDDGATWCGEQFILTFDQSKVLRKWTRENISCEATPQFTVIE